MLGKLSVKGKLMLGFGVLLLILVVLSIGAYRTILNLDRAADEVEMRNQQEKLAASIPAAVMKQSSGTRGFLLSGKETALARDEEGKREFREGMDKLTSTISTDEGKSLLAEMQRSFGPFRDVADKEINFKRAGKEKEMVEVMSTQAGAASAAVDKATAEFLAYTDRKKRESDEAQNADVSRGKVLIFSLCGVSIVVGFLVATLISRSLTGGIAGMVGMIQEMAGNNLGVPDLAITSEDEVGKAGNLLNEMKNNLRELIHSIAGTAEHVASASEEISSSASLQAQSADTQKDQTSQVATAMQEMSSTVLQVSENSGKAADASRKAAETARHGGAIVNETLTKMRAIADSVSGTAKKVEELGKSSDQIGRIIGVIDDIADQTNLLALNAAIEAARAGEQGRGFAVVADEVRKLAERTTTATKEIAQMISTVQEETKSAVAAMEEGTKQVEEGVQTTAQAGDSLKEIIHTSEQVGEMITHIATAATEQSSATEEINNNMEQIAKLVRESSEGAQQSAKACQDLSGLALDLQKMVSNFRLGEEQKGSYRGASKPHVVARRPAAKAMAASAG
jgi:methyl-accepting chemotaxis protein